MASKHGWTDISEAFLRDQLTMSAEDVTLKKDFFKGQITQAFSDKLKELNDRIVEAIALVNNNAKTINLDAV